MEFDRAPAAPFCGDLPVMKPSVAIYVAVGDGPGFRPRAPPWVDGLTKKTGLSPMPSVVRAARIGTVPCEPLQPRARPMRRDEARPVVCYREAGKHRSPDVSGAAAPPWVSDPWNPPHPERVPRWLSLGATLSGLRFVCSPCPRVALHGCAIALTLG